MIDELGLKVISDQAVQNDLSIDLSPMSTAGPRQIGSVRHGERAVLRSHRSDRLLTATASWLHALTTEAPATHLRSMNLATRPGGPTLAVPRWVTSDTALMDRLLRGADWIDGAWIELRVDSERASAITATGDVRPIDLIAVDGRTHEPDLSTPARRATALFGWIASPTPETTLDLASHLAVTVPAWVPVTTESIPTACRAIAAVLR